MNEPNLDNVCEALGAGLVAAARAPGFRDISPGLAARGQPGPSSASGC